MVPIPVQLGASCLGGLRLCGVDLGSLFVLRGLVHAASLLLMSVLLPSVSLCPPLIGGLWAQGLQGVRLESGKEFSEVAVGLVQGRGRLFLPQDLCPFCSIHWECPSLLYHQGFSLADTSSALPFPRPVRPLRSPLPMLVHLPTLWP